MEDNDRKGVFWEIWRCGNCRYGWTLPEIPPEQIGAYYPPVYLGDAERRLDDYQAGRMEGTRSWGRNTERVRLVERFVPGGALLDVGCSTGGFLCALEGSKWRRTGVEYIAEVAEMVGRRFPEMTILQGDIEAPDLPLKSFDVVTFWHVFEHLYEPRRVLERVRELLKPGGWVFISLPNFASWQVPVFRRHWYAFDVPRHQHHYSPRSLELLLTEAGFEDVRHKFFSRNDDMHQLKYSLIHWSEEWFSSRIPYYLLKPLLFGFQAGEFLAGRYGTVTTMARLG